MVALVLLAATLVELGSAPPAGMSLAQCLAIALREGREARLARAELDAAYQTMLGVRSDYHTRGSVSRRSDDTGSFSLSRKVSQGTRVSVGVNDQRTSGRGAESHFVNVESSVFTQNVLDLTLARLSWRNAQHEYRRRIEEYKLSVVTRFLDLLRAQERAKTLEASLERWRDLLAFAKARFELGISSKIDVLNTQVNMQAARTAHLAQLAAVERQRDELNDLVGLSLDGPTVATEPLEVEDPPRPEAGWRRPELDSEALRVELARSRLRDALARSRPEVKVESQLVDTGTPELLATIRYDFPLGTKQADHEFRRLRHDLETARINNLARERQVEREQRDVRRALRTARQSVEVAREAHANARESYEASQLSFQRGLVSGIELRDAQEKLTQARDNLTSLSIDYRLALYRFVRAFGGTL